MSTNNFKIDKATEIPKHDCWGVVPALKVLPFLTISFSSQPTFAQLPETEMVPYVTYSESGVIDLENRNLFLEFNNDIEIRCKYNTLLQELYHDLHDNWNNYGANPIEEEAYLNVDKIIKQAPANMLSKWNLFPSTNGTLLLTAKGDSLATINIGNRDFSYSAFISPEKNMSGTDTFEISNFLSILTHIHGLLGNG